MVLAVPPLRHMSDQDRVIVAFDVDCFYAQCEEVRDPTLRGQAIGITQKYLVVTANYAARAAGVGKLMNINEAKAKCPELVLIPGEDLEPYRAASESILSVLQRYGPACRQGLDEVFVDVTQIVQSRLAAGELPSRYMGHLHTASATLVADTRWRPQDLRVMTEGVIASSSSHLSHQKSHVRPASAHIDNSDNGNADDLPSGAALTAAVVDGQVNAGGGESVHVRVNGVQEQPAWVASLQLGSLVAWEARAAVLAETGFKLSAGIACNKALAKLCSGLHKPNDQTVLPPTEALAFLAPLPVRALPGVGFRTEQILSQMGVSTVTELRCISQSELTTKLGERIGVMLWHLAMGRDASKVVEGGPPKSITTEDSFKSCTSFPAAHAVLEVLCPDLLSRVRADTSRHKRAPTTLTVKWRHRADRDQGVKGYGRTSASVPWPFPPSALLTPDPQVPGHMQGLIQAAMGVLRQKLGNDGFCLTLINVGATNFKPLLSSSPLSANHQQPSMARYLLNRSSSGSQLNTTQVAPRQTPQASLPTGSTVGRVRALLQGRSMGTSSAGNESGGVVDNGDDWANGRGDGGKGVICGWEQGRTDDDEEGFWDDWDEVQGPPGMSHGVAAGVAGSSGLLAAHAGGNRAAAAQSTISRRDYGCAPVPGLMSKSRERQLREAMRAAAPPPLPMSALYSSSAPAPAPPLAPRLKPVPGPLPNSSLSNPSPQPLSLLASPASALPSPVDGDMMHVQLGNATAHASLMLLPPNPLVPDNRPATVAIGGGEEGGKTPATCSKTEGHGYDVVYGLDTVGGVVGRYQLPCGDLSDAGFLHYEVEDAWEGEGEEEEEEDPWQGDEQPLSEGWQKGVSMDLLREVHVCKGKKQGDIEDGVCGVGGHAGDNQQVSMMVRMPMRGPPPGAVMASELVPSVDANLQQTSTPPVAVAAMGITSQPHDLSGTLTSDTLDVDKSTLALCATRVILTPLITATVQQHNHASAHALEFNCQQKPVPVVQSLTTSMTYGTPVPKSVPIQSEQSADTQSGWHTSPVGDRQLYREQEQMTGHIGLAAAERIVLHCDVDCFYCQVERLDDPSLQGVPLAVRQFNSGGFVAVSYEARAAGVRCGDGVGAGGRANITRLKAMGAVSEEEAKKRCPGLQVRPMRTDRYRQVADQITEILKGFAPGRQVEKTSYDDFFLDVTPLVTQDVHDDINANGQQGLPAVAEPGDDAIVAGGGTWSEVCLPLSRGVTVARQLRAAIQLQLGMTVSVGVSTNKLLARCIGPLNKPDKITVLPSCRAVQFMSSIPIKAIPSLRGKGGEEVVAALNVNTVGELAAFTRVQLEGRFGRVLGAKLAGLPLGMDDNAPVRSRGPQKSILVERSYPPLTRFAAVRQALEPLVIQLWMRLVEDTLTHERVPNKLTLTWRQGYGNPRSKTGDMPGQVVSALRGHAQLAVPDTQNTTNEAAVDQHQHQHCLPQACAPLTPQQGVSHTTSAQQSMCAANSVPAHKVVQGISTAVQGNPTVHGTSNPVQGLRSGLSMPQPGDAHFLGCHTLLETCCWIFKSAMSTSGGRGALQITRLSVAAVFGAGQVADAGQRRINAFMGSPSKTVQGQGLGSGISPAAGAGGGSANAIALPAWATKRVVTINSNAAVGANARLVNNLVTDMDAKGGPLQEAQGEEAAEKVVEGGLDEDQNMVLGDVTLASVRTAVLGSVGTGILSPMQPPALHDAVGLEAIPPTALAEGVEAVVLGPILSTEEPDKDDLLEVLHQQPAVVIPAATPEALIRALDATDDTLAITLGTAEPTLDGPFLSSPKAGLLPAVAVLQDPERKPLTLDQGCHDDDDDFSFNFMQHSLTRRAQKRSELHGGIYGRPAAASPPAQTSPRPAVQQEPGDGLGQPDGQLPMPTDGLISRPGGLLESALDVGQEQLASPQATGQTRGCKTSTPAFISSPGVSSRIPMTMPVLTLPATSIMVNQTNAQKQMISMGLDGGAHSGGDADESGHGDAGKGVANHVHMQVEEVVAGVALDSKMLPGQGPNILMHDIRTQQQSPERRRSLPGQSRLLLALQQPHTELQPSPRQQHQELEVLVIDSPTTLTSVMPTLSGLSHVGSAQVINRPTASSKAETVTMSHTSHFSARSDGCRDVHAVRSRGTGRDDEAVSHSVVSHASRDSALQEAEDKKLALRLQRQEVNAARRGPGASSIGQGEAAAAARSPHVGTRGRGGGRSAGRGRGRQAGRVPGQTTLHQFFKKS